jgi:hypothetical protein
VKRITRRPWTDEEEVYLTSNAHRFSAEYIGLRLKRTAEAVRCKAERMGVSFVRWPDEDLHFLRKNAARMTAREIAGSLGKDKAQVIYKAKTEGILFGPTRRKFTARQG